MSKIQVAVRIRPEADLSRLSKNITITRDNGIDLYVNTAKHEFQFDKVFSDEANQETVFKHSLTKIIGDVIEGFNGCILTYGQTGAGKTYTMSGPTADNYEERGLVARTASAIFQTCARMTDSSVTIRLSVLEIYNETLIDLFREPISTVPSANTAPPNPKLSIIETSSGVVIPALYILPISSEDDAYTLILEAYQHRIVAEHQLNRKSSRSHVIYTFYVTRTRSEDDVVQSKLNLVDLAGSERVEKTGTSGVNQKEASYINKSLSFLEQVVLALGQSKRDHIPYRQSKLTYILKDSLGGNCATYLIACIWPSQLHEWETLSTLRFATRMKSIENHPIRNSLVSKEPQGARLLQQIELLKKELIMRDTMNQMDPWLPDLTKPQRLKTLKLVANIAKDRPTSHDFSLSADTDLDLKSISQCKLMLGFMRKCLWDACGGDGAEVASIIHNVTNSALGNDQSPVPAAKTKSKVDSNLKAVINNSIPTGPHSGRSNMNRGEDFGNITPTYDNSNTYQSPRNAKISEDTNNSQIKSGGRVSDKESNEVVNNEIENSYGDNLTQVNNNGITINDNDNINDDSASGGSGSTSIITFETFSAGEGKVYHDSFMDTKEALKANKARQKEIIQILNRQKIIIDNCAEILQRKEQHDNSLDHKNAIESDRTTSSNSIPVNEMSGEYISEIRMQHESSKRDYRAAHNELQICKKQVGELEALKQRALAVLLKEFDEFSKKNGKKSADNIDA